MKGCCVGFQANFAHRHERGFSVYVLPPIAGVSPDPGFHIGCWCVAPSEVARVSAADQVAISLHTSTGMRFCPWCGVPLDQFYHDTWQELLDDQISDEFQLPT